MSVPWFQKPSDLEQKYSMQLPSDLGARDKIKMLARRECAGHVPTSAFDISMAGISQSAFVPWLEHGKYVYGKTSSPTSMMHAYGAAM
jgi:hypothetical protein